MNDTEQVIAARSGGAGAFEALVHRYYGMAYGLAYAHVREAAAAQDVAQEAFLLAWANLERLRHPEGFLMWLRRIVRNCALNWLRSEEYRHKLSARLAERDAVAAAVAPSAVAHLEQEERAARIHEALGRLSPKLREALVVFYFEGKSVRQAADGLGIKSETLKKRIQLGRARLRLYLQRQEEAELEDALSGMPAAGPGRVMTALSVGPAVPGLRQAVSTSHLKLWLHHLLHGGSVRLSEAALALAGGLKVAAVSIVVVSGVAIAGAVFLSAVQDRHGGAGASPALPAAAIADTEQPRVGILTVDHHSDALGRHLLILGVFKDTPAKRAGLRFGDCIIAIDGRPLSAALDENVRRIRGPLGSSVHLTVMRPKQHGKEMERLELDIVRSNLELPSGDKSKRGLF